MRIYCTFKTGSLHRHTCMPTVSVLFRTREAIDTILHQVEPVNYNLPPTLRPTHGCPTWPGTDGVPLRSQDVHREQHIFHHQSSETVTCAASNQRLRSCLPYNLLAMPTVALVLLRLGSTPAVICVYFAADMSSHLVH